MSEKDPYAQRKKNENIESQALKENRSDNADAPDELKTTSQGSRKTNMDSAAENDKGGDGKAVEADY